jgi:inner membrane organizing system protein 1
MAEKIRSEDEIGLKWDRCISDLLIKSGAGFGVGALFSLLLFKRRPWPIGLGTGLGAGMALSNCQHDFKRTNERVIIERIGGKEADPHSSLSSESGDHSEDSAAAATDEAENNH